MLSGSCGRFLDGLSPAWSCALLWLTGLRMPGAGLQRVAAELLVQELQRRLARVPLAVVQHEGLAVRAPPLAAWCTAGAAVL